MKELVGIITPYQKLIETQADDFNIITIGDKKDTFIEPKNEDLIKINIILVKSRKFSKYGTAIIKKEPSNLFESQKIRFNVKFNINSKQTDYNFKKSLIDLLNFNSEILSIFESKINYVSPLMIQLKNINEILIQNPNNISPQLVKLEEIYLNLSRNFLFFVTEILKFAEINNKNLEKIISNKLYESYTCDYDKLKKNKKNKNSFHQENHKSMSLSISDFFSELDRKSQANNDFVKTMSFLNNIITSLEYITVSVIEIKNSRNYIDSVLQLEIKFNNINKPLITTIKLPSIELFKHCETRKGIKIIELKKLLKEMKSIINNHGINLYKKKISYLITYILNDLFYLDNNLFTIFEINKLLVILY